MIEWLLELLLMLLTRTIFWPMVRSGQEVRIRREYLRSLSIQLHNHQLQNPHALPTPAYFKERKKHITVMFTVIAAWTVGLIAAAWLAPDIGALTAIGSIAFLILGYFHVSTAGMPEKLRRSPQG